MSDASGPTPPPGDGEPVEPADPSASHAAPPGAEPDLEPTEAEVAAAEAEAAADAERRRRATLLVGGLIVAVLMIVGLAWLVSGDDGDDDVATEPSTTTTTAAEETTTTAPTTAAPTTTEAATTTTGTSGGGGLAPLGPDDAAFVVWPAPDGDVRYDDPVDAVTAFATELVGFTNPIVGELQQGDSRSGEIEVRADEQGPVTVVLVRQYGEDDSWWVIGAATADIEVDEPQPQQAIDDPLTVSGRARAFEGTVEVLVMADGQTEPLGTGVVTGRGDGVLGPFTGEIAWSNPGGGWGSVLFLTRSAEDGRVWQVTAIRVGFIGGD